jgi:hypothetical protein
MGQAVVLVIAVLPVDRRILHVVGDPSFWADKQMARKSRERRWLDGKLDRCVIHIQIPANMCFQIALLVLSSSIISGAVYFLWQLTKFPEMGNFDASLIGVTITCCVFLCAWGIGSRKGNPVESSLLVSFGRDL